MKTQTNSKQSSKREQKKQKRISEKVRIDEESVYIEEAIALLLERPGTCVLCLAGEEGGIFDNSGGIHHIFSKARLRGKKNFDRLWNPVNLAVSCIIHHEKYGEKPWVWTAAMVKLGFATEEDYEMYYKITRPKGGVGELEGVSR